MGKPIISILYSSFIIPDDMEIEDVAKLIVMLARLSPCSSDGDPRKDLMEVSLKIIPEKEESQS